MATVLQRGGKRRCLPELLLIWHFSFIFLYSAPSFFRVAPINFVLPTPYSMPSTRSSKDAALKQAALEAKPDQASNIDVKILEKILTKRQHLIWSGGLLLAPLAFIIGLAGLAILLGEWVLLATHSPWYYRNHLGVNICRISGLQMLRNKLPGTHRPNLRSCGGAGQQKCRFLPLPYSMEACSSSYLDSRNFQNISRRSRYGKFTTISR